MRFASRSTETTIPCTKGTRATLPGRVSTESSGAPGVALERGHHAQPAPGAVLAGPSHDLVLVEESRAARAEPRSTRCRGLRPPATRAALDVADALEAQQHPPEVRPRVRHSQHSLRVAVLPDEGGSGDESVREIGADGNRDLARDTVGALDASDDQKLRVIHGIRRGDFARRGGARRRDQSRTRMRTFLPRAVAAADTKARIARIVRPSRPIRRPRSASGTSMS